MKRSNLFAFIYQLLKPTLCALVLFFTVSNAWAGSSIGCTPGGYVPAGATTCTTCTANNYCPSGTAINLPASYDQLIYSCSSNTGDVYTRSAAGSDAKEDCRGQINLYVNGSSTYPVTFYGTSYSNNSSVKSIHAYYTSSTSYVDGCSWNSTNWCKRKSTDFYMSSLPTSSNVTRSGFTLKGWTVGNADGATYVSTSNKTPKLTGTANLYAQWTKSCSAGYYLQQSNASCVQCPAVSSGTGYYCPGGALEYNTAWADKGKKSCPSGYPWSEAGNSSINSCYITMSFYPSKDAVFRGATYASDAQYGGLWNRYKQDNSWFTLVSDTDGQKHMTAKLLVGGDTAPTKSDYTFTGWMWQSENVTSSECTSAGMTLNSSNRGCNLNGLSSCPSDYSYYGGLCIPDSKLTAVTASTNIITNTQRNFYAKYFATPYKITYNTNGGQCSAGSSSPNLLSVQPSSFSTSNNGITISTTGNGVYTISGTASANARLYIPFNPITIPTSVGNGGTGLIAMNNNQAFSNSEVLFQFYNDDSQLGGYQLSSLYRYASSYSSTLGGQAANRISIYVKSGTTLSGLTIAPAIYNDGRTTPGEHLTAGYVYGETHNCKPVIYTKGTSTITLPTPTKDGYTFVGWYTSSSFSGSAVTTIATGSTGNKTFYAKWAPKSCPAGKYYTTTATECQPCPAGSYCPGFSVNSNPGTANIGATTCPSSYPNSISTSIEGARSINDCYKEVTESCSVLAPTSVTWPNGTMTQDSTGTAMQFYNSSEKVLASGCAIPDVRVGGPSTLSELQTAINNNSDLSCNAGYHPEYVNSTYANADYTVSNWYCRAHNDAYNSPDVTGLDPGDWKVVIGGGTVKGRSVCSFTHGGGSPLPTISQNHYGPYCWCQATSFTPTSGSAQSVTDQWFLGTWYGGVTSSNTNCETDCAAICGSAYVRHDSLSTRYMWATICRATTYNISYVLNSGTQASDPYTTYNGDILPLTLKNPTRLGYTFAGWCDNSGLTQNCSTTKTITAGTTGDKTYYAKWTPTNYTITYNTSSGYCTGGDASNHNCTPTSYTIETATFTIPNPTKDTYVFGGWCDDAELTQNCTLNKQIALGSTGDKTYYAKWKKTCAAGTYLPAASETCTQCTENYYCVGGSYDYSETNTRGITPCPVSYFPHSAAGATASSSCYSIITLRRTMDANYSRTMNVYAQTNDTNYTSSINRFYFTETFLTTTPSQPVTGYTFDGYSSNQNLSNPVTTSNYFVGDQTLYERWTANTIDLTWDTNGGNSTATNTGSGGSATTCTYDGDITLPNAEPTKTGFSFTGWKLDNN